MKYGNLSNGASKIEFLNLIYPQQSNHTVVESVHATDISAITAVTITAEPIYQSLSVIKF
jgi:hypothetical protein